MSNIFNNIVEYNGNIINNSWIEWDHFKIPNEPEAVRLLIRLIMFTLLNHCLVCTSLDGCYFTEEKMPNLPLHEKCDCKTIKVSNTTLQANAYAYCNIAKFKYYIFVNPNKKQLFNSWGYTEDDSELLKIEFEKQAISKYLNGDYILGNLDIFGQRISIEINLNGHSFFSGWMVCPNGLIKNTTPFGGWSK